MKTNSVKLHSISTWLVSVAMLAGCSQDLAIRVSRPDGVPDPTTTRSIDDHSSFAPGDRVDVGAAEVVVTGPSGTTLGRVLAMPGDIDGDGLADLVLGSDGIGGGLACDTVCLQLRRAAVQILHGSAELGPELTARIATLRGVSQVSDQLGLSPAGDIDGDGRADFLATLPSPSDCSPGSTALVYGGAYSALQELQDVAPILRDDELCTAFGEVATGVGDIDGDGHGDYAIAAAGQFVGLLTGRLHVYYGGPGRLSGRVAAASHASAALVTADRAHGFGLPHPVGDVNGDGYDDFIVASRFSSPDAFLVLGRPERMTGTVEVESISIPIHADGWVHPSGGPVGDLDGDGRDDLAFITRHGSARDVSVIHGRAEWPASIDVDRDASFWFAAHPDEPSCESVVGAGDVNGDGFADVLCGAPDHRNGAAFLLLGAAERRMGRLSWEDDGVAFLGRDVSEVLGPSVGDSSLGRDRSGASIAGGSDLNGDGFDDFVIGAPGDVGGDSHSGHVYVFLGRP